MIFTSISELCALLRLCRRYSEFRLRLSRTGLFVVKPSSSLVAEPPHGYVNYQRPAFPAGSGARVSFAAAAPITGARRLSANRAARSCRCG